MTARPPVATVCGVPLLLDLLRHAAAAPAGDGGDPARPLTQAGEAALRSLASRLAAAGPGPDRAFAGPRLRAAESARIVLSIWRPDLPIETLPELEPETDPAKVLLALEACGVTAGHALLVGHLPLLDRLCMLLTGGPAGFSAGSLHRIEFEGPARPRGGRSLWHVEP